MSETSQDKIDEGIKKFIALQRALVTVVIPCYNYANVVARAIDSVKAQTLTNFECFVVDNKSTDSSEEVIKAAIKGDARFYYLQCSDQGVAHARNKGVFTGNAPFVCCLDADDQIAPEFLEICVSALEKDRSLGIAYTGLFFIKPDGRSGLSPWPGKFDYDAALKGQNQIPTCNVSRREIWERLGGQRQRYAPFGAGEEDAEMWLRACALGWRAEKVTDAGLFIYSWMSGRVSGNKDHRMVDYRAWHPWTKDEKHPFASAAKPKKYSHLVRQYDEPSISVIIPVGPGHEKDVINALDSLEAQTLRGWESILIWDNNASPRDIHKAYPFVRFAPIPYNKDQSFGAGYARNRGVEIARSNFLLFLDADDWLVPDALESMIIAYAATSAIVYSDYVGKSFIDDDLRRKLGDRVLEYDERDKHAVIRYKSNDYDYEKAVRQPHPEENGYPFQWNLITSLTPKLWHDEIGGFDENMKSWEDWDYWIRMAKAGKPFVRIPEILVVYRFYTGNRREIGLQSKGDLIKYMEEKYKGINIMPCRSCGKKIYETTHTSPPTQSPMSAQSQGLRQMNDDDYILISYEHPNRGSHNVVGPQTGTVYGYRSGGGQEKFLVHKADQASMPGVFVPVNIRQPEVVQAAPVMESQPPVPITVGPDNGNDYVIVTPKEEESPIAVKAFDLQTIPGITPIIAQQLNALGVHEPADFDHVSDEDLQKMKGIGPARVAFIRKYVNDLLTPKKQDVQAA